jgi:hypothetical protein
MFFDQFSEPEALVEFAHQDQAAIGSDARTLEIDPVGGIEYAGRLQNEGAAQKTSASTCCKCLMLRCPFPQIASPTTT